VQNSDGIIKWWNTQNILREDYSSLNLKKKRKIKKITHFLVKYCSGTVVK
jgi:hypothetical protein